MATFKGIQGTPWHIERYHIDENDERRHRSYCKYYNKQTRRCSMLISECYGASHCKYYSISEKKKRKKEDRVPVKKGKKEERLPVQIELINRPHGFTHNAWNNMTFNAYLDLVKYIEGKKSFDYFCYQNQELLTMCCIIDRKQKYNLMRIIQKKMTFMTEDGLRVRPIKVFRSILINESIKNT